MPDNIPPHVSEWASGAVSAMGLNENDPLVLTGSAVLPFDTQYGDIDLLLIASTETQYDAFAERRHPERRSEQLANGYAMSYFDHNGVEVDLEVWSRMRVERAISDLPSGIATIDDVETDFTRVGGLEVKVGTDLFHALMLGAPVHGAASFAALRESISWPNYLAWKRDAHLINVRDATKGIPASLRANRVDEAFMKLCWAADNAADAMIYHSGNSINRWKWRLRYLPFIDQEIASWYRGIRFSEPALDADSLEGHVEVLRDICRNFIGTEPQPVRLPATTAK